MASSRGVNPAEEAIRVYKKATPEGTRNVVVVLAKKEIPIGTLKSMLRQAGMTEKQLFNLLD